MESGTSPASRDRQIHLASPDRTVSRASTVRHHLASPDRTVSPATSGRRVRTGRRKSATALSCAIAQVIAGPLSGIPAIVLGVMSMREIRRTGEQGHGMAMAGLVLGIIGLILEVLALILIIILFTYFRADIRQPAFSGPSSP